MFCEKCGKEIGNGESVCQNCQNPVCHDENLTEAVGSSNYDDNSFAQTNQQMNQQPFYQVNPTIRKKALNFEKIKIILNAIGSFSGLLSFIYGIVLGSKTYPIQYTTRGTYGGDAYTGIQNAAADTSSNLIIIAKILRDGMAMLFAVIGLAILSFFLCRLIELIKESKKAN